MHLCHLAKHLFASQRTLEVELLPLNGLALASLQGAQLLAREDSVWRQTDDRRGLRLAATQTRVYRQETSG